MAVKKKASKKSIPTKKKIKGKKPSRKRISPPIHTASKKSLPARPRKRKILRPIKCRYCKLEFKFGPRQKKNWVSNGMVCPHCQTDLCVLPDSERALFKLQKKYFASHDKAVLGEMYKILQPYAKSLLHKAFSIITEKQDQERCAHRAAWFLLEHYYNNKNFRIGTSFGAYLRHTLRQAVYDKEEKPDERTVSMNLENDESKAIFELASPRNVMEEIEKEQDHNNVMRHIKDFLFTIKDYVPTGFEELMRLIGLRTRMHNGEKLTDRFYSSNNRVGKDHYEFTMRSLYKELHDLQRGDV